MEESPEAIIAALRQELAQCRLQGNRSPPPETNKGALSQNDKKGAFVRKDAVFRNSVQKGGEFPPESGRYILYVSYACPWACRCLALLHLKNLTQHIEVCSVYPVWQRTRPKDPNDAHCGWVFVDPEKKDLHFTNTAGYGKYGQIEKCTKDTLFGKKSIRDIYETDKERETHTYSVPIFMDKKEKKIVCNESSIIIEFLNSAFDDLPGVRKDLNLSPPDLKDKMAEVDSWVYPGINNGVYKCGFAKSQEAYEAAFYNLYDSLDRMESTLSKQRYLCGDRLTLSDIRAFVTLIRFDEVYAVYFKCNGKLIREYPNILGFTREIYQMVPESVSFPQIKCHYYCSHPNLNLYGVVPIGPAGLKANRGDPKGTEKLFLQPHGRDTIFNKKTVLKFLLPAAAACSALIAGTVYLKKPSSK
eukprot:CAMPEP_0184484220 /NCGR_PEP_ID=MMETSP0113_2-20130426/5924_1 /TAXON_ID=91329 /ORGANISM="Norrisiella sphaerica, Strain BC52" /LENGTH=414 /DNA_ID=CAMNT_0026865097 /DNA_START=118 /DNA_END=1362 /DNA_ORIENTATION=+